MNGKLKLLSICIAAHALVPAVETRGEGTWGDALAGAVEEGKVSLDFRYRFETVDQDGIDEEAEASTMRSRITLQSGKIGGFQGLIEADNVTSVGPNDYNSTANGKTDYPVVADPEGTEINQILLSYRGDGFAAHGGRQRILLGSQRFIGGVAWRQNEQTYDGARVQWDAGGLLGVDFSYVHRVNRIFGPGDGAFPADLEGDNYLLRVNFKLADDHSLAAFGYLLDFDEQLRYPASRTVNMSSDSFGLEYSGRFDGLSVDASWATQSDAGDSELDYDADYYMVELGTTFEPVTVKIGYEVLAADNGVGFATPLATLHKFQGWTDRFLATPGDGVEDAYISLGGKLGPVVLTAIYHDFQAESSGTDFGTELDLLATWPVNEQFTVQAKYATFDADGGGLTDTDKAVLVLQLKL